MSLAKRLFPIILGSLMAITIGVFTPATGAAEMSYPGTEVIKTPFGFKALHQRLEAAVEKNKVFVVTRASASAGAKGRGITIPGNLVIGVYRNDFAVRMLKASVPAGIEAPLRFYLTENADKTATLAYRKPSAVFKPYGSKDLDALAAELDGIWAGIVKDTLKK